jgi:hypothetical protein
VRAVRLRTDVREAQARAEGQAQVSAEAKIKESGTEKR